MAAPGGRRRSGSGGLRRFRPASAARHAPGNPGGATVSQQRPPAHARRSTAPRPHGSGTILERCASCGGRTEGVNVPSWFLDALPEPSRNDHREGRSPRRLRRSIRVPMHRMRVFRERRPGRETWASTLDGRRDTAPFRRLHRTRVFAGSGQGRSTGALTSAPSGFPFHVRDPGRNAPAAIQAPSPGDRSRKVLRSRWRTRRVRRSAAGNLRRRTTVPEWFPNGLPERAPAGFLDQRLPGAPGGRAGRSGTARPERPRSHPISSGQDGTFASRSTATSAQSGVPQTCPPRRPVPSGPPLRPADSVALGSPHDA